MEESFEDWHIPLYREFTIDIMPVFADVGDLNPNKEDMLPIMTRVNVNSAAKAGALWAFYKWRHLGNQLGAMYCAGAAVIIKSGLCKVVIAGRKVAIDGAWIDVLDDIPNLKPINKNLKGWLQEWLSTENMELALKIIIATKLNWWLTGNHTGEPNAQGYLRKLLSTKFGKNIDEKHFTMASTIGQWASTINMLYLAGIRGLRISTFHFHVPLRDVIMDPTLSFQLKRLFALEPAGTERLAVAYRAAKKLLVSPLVKFCPRFEDFEKIAETKHKQSTRPADYHMYSEFLTGEKHEYDDTEFESMLGRLGTYVRVLLPESILATSPLLTEYKVQGYEDFSPEWYNLLKQYKKTGPIVLEGIDEADKANATLSRLKIKFNILEL